MFLTLYYSTVVSIYIHSMVIMSDICLFNHIYHLKFWKEELILCNRNELESSSNTIEISNLLELFKFELLSSLFQL